MALDVDIEVPEIARRGMVVLGLGCPVFKRQAARIRQRQLAILLGLVRSWSNARSTNRPTYIWGRRFPFRTFAGGL